MSASEPPQFCKHVQAAPILMIRQTLHSANHFGNQVRPSGTRFGSAKSPSTQRFGHQSSSALRSLPRHTTRARISQHRIIKFSHSPQLVITPVILHPPLGSVIIPRSATSFGTLPVRQSIVHINTGFGYKRSHRHNGSANKFGQQEPSSANHFGYP